MDTKIKISNEFIDYRWEDRESGGESRDDIDAIR